MALAPTKVRLCPGWHSLPEMIRNHWFWSSGWNPAEWMSLLFLSHFIIWIDVGNVCPKFSFHQSKWTWCSVRCLCLVYDPIVPGRLGFEFASPDSLRTSTSQIDEDDAPHEPWRKLSCRWFQREETPAGGTDGCQFLYSKWSQDPTNIPGVTSCGFNVPATSRFSIASLYDS